MERIDQQKARLCLLCRNSLSCYGSRQQRRSRRYVVLGKNRVHIGIGANIERNLNIHRATIRTCRLDIEHIADTHNILSQGRCDGIIDRLSVGTTVCSRHLDNRRGDIGILFDRKIEYRDCSQHHNNDRQHNGKDRTRNKELLHNAPTI